MQIPVELRTAFDDARYWIEHETFPADEIAERSAAMTGKWNQASVPHKGWTFTSVDDLGGPAAVCEMCETQDIRYVHHMEHPDYPETLGVGCVCAENMESNYEAPRRRERALRNATQRRHRWLSRKWKGSAKGNAYLNTDGLNITIFLKRPVLWGARIEDRTSGQAVTSKQRYTTEDSAKLAAFDAMISLKQKRGWGS